MTKLNAGGAKVRLSFGNLSYKIIPREITSKFVSDLTIDALTLTDVGRSFMRGGYDEVTIVGRAYAIDTEGLLPKIQDVIFNPPATIVLWGDGTKTVVKCEGCPCQWDEWDACSYRDCSVFDPEKGLAMAIAKKALGNKGNYYNVFKKWLGDNE